MARPKRALSRSRAAATAAAALLGAVGAAGGGGCCCLLSFSWSGIAMDTRASRRSSRSVSTELRFTTGWASSEISWASGDDSNEPATGRGGPVPPSLRHALWAPHGKCGSGNAWGALARSPGGQQVPPHSGCFRVAPTSQAARQHCSWSPFQCPLLELGDAQLEVKCNDFAHA